MMTQRPCDFGKLQLQPGVGLRGSRFSWGLGVRGFKVYDVKLKRDEGVGSLTMNPQDASPETPNPKH